MRLDYAQLPRAFALSRSGYYLDFVLAPSTAAVLVAIELVRGAPLWTIMVLLVVGAIAWALAEYLIHRFVFHGPLHRLHDVHHRRPADFVGVASWGTFTAFGLGWCFIMGLSGASTANGITAGILLGYLFYIAIHDHMHHGDRSRFGRYLRFMYALHAGHHRGGHANFGVSSPLFDFVFRTYRRAGARPQ